MIDYSIINSTTLRKTTLLLSNTSTNLQVRMRAYVSY